MTKGGRAGEAERVDSVPGDATGGAPHGKQARLETRLAKARALETRRRHQAAEAVEAGRKIKKRGRQLDEATSEVTRLAGRLDRLRAKDQASKATSTPEPAPPDRRRRPAGGGTDGTSS
jgi:DNA repair exonuclease SbcCD ATPase subunit